MILFMAKAHAENWAAIGVVTNGQTIYVDTDNMDREDGFARIWLKVGVEKRLFSFNAVTDSIDQIVLNCKERTFAIAKSIAVKSNGERVSIKEVDSAAWSFRKVVDSSPVSNHWSQFCPVKVVNKQPPPEAQVNPPPAAPNPRDISTGSGFFVTPDGYFVTNYHVIEGKDAVVLMDVNAKTHPARIIRVDSANDIAILKAEGNFKAIPVVSSRTVKRGQAVITVGYPHADIQGLEPKVTGGIISSFTGINNDARTFQISVALQSGNSGGPLVNLDGNVIGIVAMKLSALAVLKVTGDLPQNVNYAVKSIYLSEVLLNTPGVERKLLSPSKRTYQDVAGLTAAIEEATAIVFAMSSEEKKK